MTTPTEQPAERLPHGSWPSPLGIDDLLTAGVGLRSVIGDGDDVLWLETLPDENGRCTLVRHRGDTTVELTPTPTNVRTRVHEYGGGAHDARDGWVVYVDDTTQAVHVLGPHHSHHHPDRRVITPEGEPGLYYAGVRIHPHLGIVTAVREDHRGDGEAVTSIVALRFDDPAPDVTNAAGGLVLAEGADFYACAEVASGTRDMVWVEWDHPAMPWDRTRLVRARLEGEGGELTTRVVSTIDDGDSHSHPRMLSDGRVVEFHDTGFWAPHLLDGGSDTALPAPDADHVPPFWVHDNQVCAELDGALWVAPFIDGRRQLIRIPLPASDAPGPGTPGAGTGSTPSTEGGSQPVGTPFAHVDSLAAAAGSIWAVVGFDEAPDAVVRLDPASGEFSVVRSASAELPDPASVSVAQSLWTPSDLGEVQAWFYPPQLTGFAGPEGELPPLVVRSHGGPTSMAVPSYNPMIQFWTTRGFAVVDVNYSGSTGFGREYRNRLRGTWGIADVDDCVAVVRRLAAEGLVDAERVAITGGSAGGYTTLQALVTTDVFSAGVSRYGIGDLEVLVGDTHKFESRYPESLVGPYPARRDLYVERSPIHHVDRLSTPMLILQGLDDKVVPPNQAESMAAAVRAKGLPVAMVLFEGEGHGFRGLAARRRALEAELSFLGQLFGFVPADEVAHLAIENLHG